MMNQFMLLLMPFLHQLDPCASQYHFTGLSYEDLPEEQLSEHSRVPRRAADASIRCPDDSDLIDSMLRKHNKRQVPLPEAGTGPAYVSVEMWVQDVSRIMEITSEIELDIYVTEQWIDTSLAFQTKPGCKTKLSLNAEKVLGKLWTPSSFFVNSKNASMHRSPYLNTFLMIYTNGTVWMNYRIKLIGPCKKDLRTFPIDRQRCFLIFESLYYNKESVHMYWIDLEPLKILKTIRLPDYELSGTKTDQSVRARYRIDNLSRILIPQ